MEKVVPSWSLADLAKIFDGDLAGPPDLMINKAIPADGADPHGLTFAESEDFLRRAAAGGAAAVLSIRGAAPVEKPTIFVDRPREAFGRFLAMVKRPMPLNSGIHPTAVVSPDAVIAESAEIGPYAVIERGATVGERCRVFPFCYVGEDCKVGDETVLYPQVVLYQGVVLGRRCVIHSGAVLGADGFGFVWTGERQHKVPQVGGVIFGDDVEVGANSSVDRATSGDTLIGSDVKLDNLVQIGHNVTVGDHTVMASQTGIGGSSIIGRRVSIAGQVAVTDHAMVCDEVVLAGRTGVMGDVTQPGTYFGIPARPLGEAMRNLARFLQLQDLFKRVEELEKRGGA